MTKFQNGRSPIQTEAYARRTQHLHLSDFKVALGAAGLEVNSLEAYRPPVGWVPILWDTPYRIYAAGEMVLIRVRGVTELQDWDIHAPFIT